MLPVTELPSLDRLVLLPEDEAVRAHFDARNCRVLFRLLLLFVLAAMGIALALAVSKRFTELLIPLSNLVLIRILYVLRERPVFTRRFRLFLLSFLVLQPLLWKAAFFDVGHAFHPADFIAPIFLIFFRLPPGGLAIPLGTLWGLSAGRNFLEALIVPDQQLEYSWIVAQTAITAVVFAAANHFTRKQRFAFLVDWRRELHRHRERRRMKEELDDARKIQLSMLPRSDPRLAWLDVAGISIPASEVGGDYYDYFTISPTRQAIVVGDVAGHGMASGLILAGVRSCLHLLNDECVDPPSVPPGGRCVDPPSVPPGGSCVGPPSVPPGGREPLEPAEILARIDRMLRQTAVSRSFVTLLYALFDHQADTLTFASAGHPPILHRTPDGEVHELGIPALPLGTRLGSRVGQRTLPVGTGDVFLLTTDGLSETLDPRHDVYGDERLVARLRVVTPEKSAREIRDAVLSDLWTFKADGEQLDDITVVVVKLR